MSSVLPTLSLAGFLQITASPADTANEVMEGSGLAGYQLSALPLTNGLLDFGPPQHFFTSGGTLVLKRSLISAALSFEATTVPEPATWAMMLAGFVGLSLLGYRRTVKARAAA